MNICLAIGILLGYTLLMIKAGGKVPSSLSASVFDLKPSQRWIWTVTICVVCFLCVPTYIDKVSENTKFLAFISIAGLAFVGAAPLVNRKDNNMQFQVHQWGAIVCAVCSQLVLVFNQPLMLVGWVPFVAYEAYRFRNVKKWRTEVFWAEMVCFASTFAYCLL